MFGDAVQPLWGWVVIFLFASLIIWNPSGVREVNQNILSNDNKIIEEKLLKLNCGIINLEASSLINLIAKRN